MERHFVLAKETHPETVSAQPERDNCKDKALGCLSPGNPVLDGIRPGSNEVNSPGTHTNGLSSPGPGPGEVQEYDADQVDSLETQCQPGWQFLRNQWNWKPGDEDN